MRQLFGSNARCDSLQMRSELTKLPLTLSISYLESLVASKVQTGASGIEAVDPGRVDQLVAMVIVLLG